MVFFHVAIYNSLAILLSYLKTFMQIKLVAQQPKVLALMQSIIHI